MTDDKKVKKLGMKDIQREGWEYELTVSLNLDRDTHTAQASKDRTELFEGKDPFVITEKTGEIIKQWCETGIDLEKERKAELVAAVKAIGKAKDKAALTAVRVSLPDYIVSDASFIAAGKKRYEVIMAEAPKQVTQAGIAKQVATP